MTDNTPDKKEIIMELIQNDAALAIIMGLHYFQPLNLSQISEFIGKTAPTTIHHIKKLLKSQIIQLDIASAIKAGKYYILSQMGSSILNITIEQVAEEDTMVNFQYDDPKHYLLVKQALMTLGSIQKTVMDHTARYLSTNAEKLAKKSTKDKIDKINPFEILMYNLKLQNEDQEKRLSGAMDQVLTTMKDIEKENKSNPDDYNKMQYVFMYTVPISEMPPFRRSYQNQDN